MAIREPYVPTPAIERAYTRTGLAALILAISAAILALAILLYVLWKVFSGVNAIPFDSDGVRCYAKADIISCIKTAEPPR